MIARSYSEFMAAKVIYNETLRPWFFALIGFIPFFRKYGILIEGYETKEKKEIQQNDTNYKGGASITFGYGFNGPKPGHTLIAHRTLLHHIDRSSIKIGDASWKDNLFQFGGWGIRYGRGGTWAYNASLSGSYIEFVEVAGSKRTKYRIVTEDPKAVAAFLRNDDSNEINSLLK